MRLLCCCCRLISDHQLETTGSGQLTPVLRLLAGAGAGIVAMSATYPLDMVRPGAGQQSFVRSSLGPAIRAAMSAACTCLGSSCRAVVVVLRWHLMLQVFAEGVC